MVASPWYTVEQARSLDRLARALGEGLAEPAARAALHASLRASALSEHKVVLLDFLGTAQGRVLLAAAADRSHQTAEELRSLATTLPPVDLYVPHISHRQTWQIQDRIAVAALVDEFSPLFGYVAGRDSLFIDRLSTTPNPVAVLLLGPNEYKQARPGAGSSLGDHRFIENPRTEQICLEDCGGGGGGGGPPPPTDSLWGDTLATVNICDNGFCWEGNEFEISAIYPTGTGYTRLCGGIGSTAVVRLRFVCNGFLNKISETAPTEFPYVDVRVIETDGWPNPDDWFYAYRDPPPSSAIDRGASLQVVDNGLRRNQWVLFKVDYGAGCTPYCMEWVELMLKW
ncbi:MAG: hypothetical protein Q8Q85_12880 [Gemmatimonadales bacterium]|nr:hypothetical protein [Gemmatimonadales bacterium]